MNDTLRWVDLVISSGLIFAIVKILIILGKMIQKQEDHDQRLRRIEKRIDYSDHDQRLGRIEKRLDDAVSALP